MRRDEKLDRLASVMIPFLDEKGNYQETENILFTESAKEKITSFKELTNCFEKKNNHELKPIIKLRKACPTKYERINHSKSGIWRHSTEPNINQINTVLKHHILLTNKISKCSLRKMNDL